MDNEIAAILAELRCVERECTPVRLAVRLLQKRFQSGGGNALPLLMELVEQVQVRP